MGREAYLGESQALDLMLVRAVEERDPEGHLLPRSLRRDADRELAAELEAAGLGKKRSRRKDAQLARSLARRARALSAELDRCLPWLGGFRRAARPGVGLTPAVLLAAFAFGLATGVLGPQSRVNLLSFPLLAVFAWNLFLYLALGSTAIARAARRGGSAPTPDTEESPAPPRPSLLARVLTSLQGRVRQWRFGALSREANDESATILPRALGDFSTSWATTAAPLAGARGRRALNLAAAALICGMIGSMYLKGLAFRYQATWESTFLGATQVQALLDLVLGPPATLLGVEVPPVEPLEAPATGPAALWVHLFAAAAALYVVLPRLALAALAGTRVAALRSRVPVDLATVYFRRLLAAGRGERQRLTVLPYSLTLPPRGADSLRTALFDLFGSKTDLRVVESLSYGDELTELGENHEDLEDGEGASVVIFNLAQSPETEVHGELVAQLEARRHRGLGGPVLPVVEGSAYRRRLAGDAAENDRLQERRKAWDRVLQDAGLTAAHIDLETMDVDELHQHLAALVTAEDSKNRSWFRRS